MVERIGRSVDHAGEGQVVDVLRRAGDLGVTVFATNVRPNRARHIAQL